MFLLQSPVMETEEFSRCDERTQSDDAGKHSRPMAGTDASLKASVERAIWNDEVLRAIEYYEVDVLAKDGLIHLSGHIANRASQNRIENSIRSVPGIRGFRNYLVLDEKLTVEVAGALGTLEHTHNCKFFTGSSHGVISITGSVSTENVKSLAEMCAAENPNVRAVINHVRVSGTSATDLQDLPFLQPIIGETIYFLDGFSGIVKQVVINPHNRRVIAMGLLVNFSGPQLPFNPRADGNASLPARLVLVPMDAVRYLTKVSGFLLINSTERSRYHDLDADSFMAPSVDWTPPYPYCPQDVLFPVEYQQAMASVSNEVPPSPLEELLQGASIKEQSFATDDMGA
jgi:osmotically-inducible protein OsmY